MEYWLSRLNPMINRNNQNYKKFAFFCANRVGKEQKDDKIVTYRGTSCALTVNPI